MVRRIIGLVQRGEIDEGEEIFLFCTCALGKWCPSICHGPIRRHGLGGKYNGPGNSLDWANDIAVDASGNIYVTGVINWGDMGTIKYYPNGDTAWSRLYDGPGNDIDAANALALDKFGSVYVTGLSAQSSTPPQNFDYATIKYYPDGDEVWAIRYNGPANEDDDAQAITVDDTGNVYVTGYSFGIGTDKDYATIKYIEIPTEIEKETRNETKPLEFVLSQNYPNPFNANTEIHYRIPEDGPVAVKVFNTLGQEVRTLVDAEKKAGGYVISCDGRDRGGRDVASGIYCCQLKAGDFDKTIKMVLIK